MIEGCAGGNARADVGLLARVDQIWPSDNTNPADRIFIQYGFSHAFPANTMVCWTTDNDPRRVRPSLEFRFRVSMAGVLGVGNMLTKWGQPEIDIARREIARYKLIRPIVQRGDLYRLISPFTHDRAAIEYVAENRSAAVVFMYNLAPPLPDTRPSTRGPERLSLRGLDPTATYVLDLDLNGKATGHLLAERGLPWLPRGNYQASIVRLRRWEGEP